MRVGSLLGTSSVATVTVGSSVGPIGLHVVPLSLVWKTWVVKLLVDESGLANAVDASATALLMSEGNTARSTKDCPDSAPDWQLQSQPTSLETLTPSESAAMMLPFAIRPI